ncbi:hypothetical protein GMSM_33530 [Geomonas sp. Red276]
MTSTPCPRAVLVTALMAAFIPEQSPPLVRIPIFFIRYSGFSGFMEGLFGQRARQDSNEHTTRQFIFN